jgi:hypothetical protein
MQDRKHFPVAAALLCIATVLAAPPAQALDKCKVKIDKKTGTLLVSARNVTGTVLWGAESGSETNAFSNAGTCVVAPNAKKCELAAEGEVARITPPELCTLYLVDDAPSSCQAYIKGCTPGVRNTGLAGDGFVKGWARINADGTIASCYNCNPDTNETRKISTGAYEVDFTPLGDDVTGRPRSATLDNLSGSAPQGEIGVADRSGDSSSVFVATRDDGGTFTDKSFVVVIY